MIKVGIVTGELLLRSGSVRQVLELARGLQAHGCRPLIFTTRYAPATCFPELTAEVEIIALHRLKVPSKAPLPLRISEYLALARLIRHYSLDLLNPHDFPATWVAQLGRGSRPIVAMINDVNHLRKPHSLIARFDYRFLRHCNRLIVLDNRAARILKEIGIAASRVVRSGVNLRAFKPVIAKDQAKRRLGFNGRDFLIFVFGIFAPHRRFEDAILGLSQLGSSWQNLRLLISGSDFYAPKEADRIGLLVKELGLSAQVRIERRVLSEEELLLRYTAADCLIFPNVEQTWGLTVIEAMAVGRPVIVSRGCGVSEVLEDGKTALLVPPQSPEAIASAISRIARDPILARLLARQGHRLVRHHLSWEHYIGEMKTVFEDVLKERSGRGN